MTEARAHIAPVAARDIERLRALAAEIWRRHYSSIISAAQIEYMLNQRYDAQLIRAELERPGLWWDKLVVMGEMIGYASYFLTGNAGEMKLDKLYVHPDHQRKGYAGMFLDHIVGVAHNLGCTSLSLTVNRKNASAIAAYHKHGFRIAGPLVTDIGEGYVMDDHLMIKDL